MSDVLAVHPETGHEAVVDSEALEHHLRQSGWLLESEYEENKAAEQQAAAEAATAKSAKSAKSTEEK